MARVQTPSPAPARMPWWQRFADLVRRTAPVWGTVAAVLVLVLAVSNLWLLNQAEQAKAMRTIALRGTEDAPDAIGTIIVSVDGDHGAIVVDSLDPLDAEHQYQVWLIKNGQRTSGGVFSVDEDGYGVLWLSSPQSLASYDAVGITIEPAGGSPGPTGIKVLGGNL
jgi:anti-sigma-K factor RskA